MTRFRLPLLCAVSLFARQSLATWIDDCPAQDPAPCLRAAAEAGDAEAEMAVGVLESLDEKGAAEVIDLDIASFRRGPISVRVLLSNPLPPVRGFPHDAADAVRWLTKAAAQGQVEAQYDLGLHYLLGGGVKADPREAAGWFAKAAAQGHTSAQMALAAFYLSGRGVEQDRRQALRWARASARQGLATAQVLMGLMEEEGSEGRAPDLAEAAHWYRLAAQQEDGFAAFCLASLEEGGRGLPRLMPDAAHWYRKAADSGFGPAELKMGDLYWDGNGVERDPRQAAAWYRRAAEAGVPQAETRLRIVKAEGGGE